MLGDSLRLLEHGTDENCAEFIFSDIRLVTEFEVFRCLRSAFFVTEQNNLDIRMKQCPALQGVALDHADVPFERLSCGKESQHRSRITRNQKERSHESESSGPSQNFQRSV